MLHIHDNHGDEDTRDTRETGKENKLISIVTEFSAKEYIQQFK